MNKVISINLNGNAYQLEEGGFEALRAYLDSAARRLESNPDKAEIIADIEEAIAAKFRSLLGASKTVIVVKEVADIIAEMGPVEDPSGAPEAPASSGSEAPGAAQSTDGAAGVPAPRRLFRIHEGAKIGGVCNGLAAYFNIDVTLVRIVFAFLIFAWGSGLLLYIIMMIILPSANTPADIAAAHGVPSATAQEFIRRAREGYYQGMRTFGDKQAYRQWKRKFKSEMRGWKRDFQREMEQNAHRWRPGWGPHPYPPGPWAPTPFISFILFVVNLAALAVLISFISTGAVFGIVFMPWWPFWARLALLIGIICLVRCPLKAIRRAHRYGYGYGGWDPFCVIWGILKWVLLIYFIIWITGGHTGLHDAVEHLPPKLHHAADSVQQWWNQQ